MNKQFAPINKNHAIAEVVFFFNFNARFADSTISLLDNVADKLKDQLPSYSPIQAMEQQVKFETHNNQPIVTNTVRKAGFELKKFNPSGQIDWVLALNDETISVNCLDYTRWEDVWGKTKSFLIEIFNIVSSQNNLNLVNFGFKCVDKFSFHGIPSEYDLSNLFKAESDFLPNQIFKATETWHCNSGWFDDSFNNLEQDNKFKVLNHFNLDSSRIQSNLNNMDQIVITIDHTQVVVFEKGIIEQELLDLNGNISNVFNKMHEMNKLALLNILNSNIAKQINLKGGVYGS